MTVRILLPGPLKSLASGRSAVDVQTSGRILSDALQALFAAHPALRDRVVTEQGEIRQHLNVFVGTDESRFTGGLATPIDEGAEISIIPAISGG